MLPCLGDAVLDKSGWLQIMTGTNLLTWSWTTARGRTGAVTAVGGSTG